MRAQAAFSRASVPLAVDLDGTLLKSDLLWESLVALLRHRPLAIFLAPFWLLGGRARLKREIARRAEIDPRALPYRESLLDYLRQERGAGRTLVLATAADGALARRVAEHLGLFSAVIASDGTRNVKGAAKLEALRAAYGERGFDYAGNGRADLPVWEGARGAVLVNPGRRALEQASRRAEVLRVFRDGRKPARLLAEALRLRQWSKNLLVFVPLFTSHHLAEAGLLGKASLAFLAFGLLASSVYLLNDLLDLENDRAHAAKRLRPFASGDLPLELGFFLAPALLVASVAVSLLLPWRFGAALALYYGATLAYSLALKAVPLVDVLALASFYALRVLAGGLATGIPISKWLLAFSSFVFLSLAFAKRVSELQALKEGRRERAQGRGYLTSDLEQLTIQGTASGYIAVLVFALYIHSPEVNLLYRTPQLLWLVCPFLLYWISRLWLWVHRRKLPEDPILFVLRDRESWLIAAAVALLVLLAAA